LVVCYAYMFDVLLLEKVRHVLAIILSYWWTYTPVILASVSYTLWMDYQRKKFINGLTWVMLEVIPPPDVPKSPKLAESIFAGLHGTYGGNLAWKKMFFQGTIPFWFSLETVSHGGEIHFLVRTTDGLRNVVEANIFAQYPDAEIRQVDDYIDLLPEDLPNNPDYDVFGTELIFTKDNAYPIKTWREFEEAGGKDEHARIDPIAPLMETMSDMRSGEYLWMQYLIRPTGGDWVKEGQAVVDKVAGKTPVKKTDPVLWFLGLFLEIIGTLLSAIGFESVQGEEKKEEKKEFSLQKLTPAQKGILENVEYKLARLAFKGGVRIMYVGRKDAFVPSRVNTVIGMFKQFYFNDLNSFKPNPKAGTKDKGILPWLFPSDSGFFVKSRTLRKKSDFYEAFRKRAFVETPVILNTEELATLWHLPGINVQAPLIPRVHAKKGQPPPYLPTS